jgi:hypothetical protein
MVATHQLAYHAFIAAGALIVSRACPDFIWDMFAGMVVLC